MLVGAFSINLFVVVVVPCRDNFFPSNMHHVFRDGCLGLLCFCGLDFLAGFRLVFGALSVFAKGLVGIQFRYAFRVELWVAVLNIRVDLGLDWIVKIYIKNELWL